MSFPLGLDIALTPVRGVTPGRNEALPRGSVPAAGNAPTGRSPGKAERAACEFEAVLLGTLLESLQKSFGGGLDDGATGSAEYGSLGTQALARAMAARGGIGIAQLVLHHLADTKVPTSQGTEVSAPR